MMGRTVHEVGTPDDAALAAEIASARALLFPSLAEGFGLPLGEALAAGTPVIAADLAALREIGGDVPDWLSPDRSGRLAPHDPGPCGGSFAGSRRAVGAHGRLVSAVMGDAFPDRRRRAGTIGTPAHWILRGGPTIIAPTNADLRHT